MTSVSIDAKLVLLSANVNWCSRLHLRVHATGVVRELSRIENTYLFGMAAQLDRDEDVRGQTILVRHHIAERRATRFSIRDVSLAGATIATPPNRGDEYEFFNAGPADERRPCLTHQKWRHRHRHCGNFRYAGPSARKAPRRRVLH